MRAYEHVASGFCSRLGLGETFFASSCSLNYWPLAVSMPPTKVCPQCKAAVPVRRKTCERCDHVFRSKRKAECNLREKAMKRMRAVKSDGVKSARKARDKLHKACEKASETRERTLHRQEQNRMRMASMRESETPDEVLRRKQSNKEAMASKRKRNVSVEHAILSFHHDIKNGPDFVCTCCHRMMYRKSGVPCNLAKYSKCSNDLLLPECV